MKFTEDQILQAIDDARAQGFSDDQIIQGAQNNFGVDVSNYVASTPAPVAPVEQVAQPAQPEPVQPTPVEPPAPVEAPAPVEQPAPVVSPVETPEPAPAVSPPEPVTPPLPKKLVTREPDDTGYVAPYVPVENLQPIAQQQSNDIAQQVTAPTGGLNSVSNAISTLAPTASTTPAGGLNAVSTNATTPAGGLTAASQATGPIIKDQSGNIVGTQADANTPGAVQVKIGSNRNGDITEWVIPPTGKYATHVQTGTDRMGNPIYGGPTVITQQGQIAQAEAEKANFVEPAWVSKAPSIIGTGVEPVYNTYKGGHDGQVDIPYGAPTGYRYDNGKSQYVYLDMNGNVTNVVNRGNGMLVPLLETAISFAVPELAPFIQGANAVQAIQSGNIIGGLASLAGAGGFNDVSSVLNTANAIKTGNISGIVGGLMNNPTINSIAGDISLSGGISLADAGAAVNLVNNIKTGNVAGVLSNASTLTGSQDLQTASTAANIVSAVQKGNISALTGLASNLSNATDAANNITDQNVLTNLATKVDEATGNDTTAGADTVSGGLNQTSVASGNDVVGGLNQTSVTGSKGNDTITASTGNDTLAGADTTLTGGQNTLAGVAGNDTVSGGLNQTSVAGASGNDSITAAAGNDTLTGSKPPAGVTTFANNVLSTALGGKKTTSNLVGRNVVTGTKPTTTVKTTAPGALTTVSKQLTAAQIAAAKASKPPAKVNVATLTPIKTTAAPPKKVDVSKLTPIKIATTLPPALAKLKKLG